MPRKYPVCCRETGEKFTMLKFLIVDDSIFSQRTTACFLRKYLPEENSEIQFAADGEEGLCRYREQKPDYVFVDLLMPKLSGTGLIHKIQREDGEKANIIVLTADVQKRVREELESCHVMAFINKPLNDEKMQRLCSRIRNGKNGTRLFSL